ncbi:MAG TPA: molybdopterin-guanine dinucleotide biosynthesis protein B [Rhodocyclaceae bacterium]
MKVFGIAGYSGSGKTTLIEKLIPLLRGHGLSVSVIKHTHHDFDLDRPGKDSWRHRQAGAAEVVLAGEHRWALLHELRETPRPPLESIVARLAPVDLVLVEGFKHEPIAKLEVIRHELGKPTLWPDDPHVVAIASDRPVDTTLPGFGLDAAEEIARFIAARVSGALPNQSGEES